MTDPTIAALAGKLTAPMRDLVEAIHAGGNAGIDNAYMPWPTLSAIRRRGLSDGHKNPGAAYGYVERLTPLGLAVAHRLRTQTEGGD